MRTVEGSTVDDSISVETLRSVLRKHSVQLAILFGSHAVGESHSESDVDIAVELCAAKHDQPEYNEAFFSLSADLSAALQTDKIDLIDIQTLSSDIAEAIFEQGVLLIGEQNHARELRHRLTGLETDERSPRERFDTALARIDEHLGTVAATGADHSQRD